MRTTWRAACAAIAIGYAALSGAQEYPAKPVRIMVPFSPGGVADNSARAISDALSVQLKQQVVIDNRPGASGNIGSQLVAQSTIHAEDEEQKHLMMDHLASQANELGADGIIFSTEAWEAPIVDEQDDRAQLRPGERKDREEAFVTYGLTRGGPCRIWHSGMNRSNGELVLDELRASEADRAVPESPRSRVGSLGRGLATSVDSESRDISGTRFETYGPTVRAKVPISGEF